MGTKETDQSTASTAETIHQYQLHLNTLGSRRPGHLMNVALAALKYLVLRGESDSIRLQAVRLLLELAPVQAKLEAMAARANVKRPPQNVNPEVRARLAALLERGGEQAQALLLETLKAEKKVQ